MSLGRGAIEGSSGATRRAAHRTLLHRRRNSTSTSWRPAVGEACWAIKAGWDAGVLPRVFQFAKEQGPPDGEWKLARQRFTGSTMTLWSADVTELDPADAGEIALVAKNGIDSAAGSS